jgi:hypothetical protein
MLIEAPVVSPPDVTPPDATPPDVTLPGATLSDVVTIEVTPGGLLVGGVIPGQYEPLLDAEPKPRSEFLAIVGQALAIAGVSHVFAERIWTWAKTTSHAAYGVDRVNTTKAHAVCPLVGTGNRHDGDAWVGPFIVYYDAVMSMEMGRSPGVVQLI